MVLRREGSVVASAKVKLEPGRDRYTVPLSFAPDATGTFVFTLEARPLPGEAIAGNNARSFALRVIRDRVRVLLVAGRPSWDERFLRGAPQAGSQRRPRLASSSSARTPTTPGRRRTSRSSPSPWPRSSARSSRPSTRSSSSTSPGRPTAASRSRATSRGSGTTSSPAARSRWWAASRASARGATARPRSPRSSRSSRSTASRRAEEEFRPRLTAEGRRHPVMRLAAGDGPNAAAWEALPALPGLNLVRALPPARERRSSWRRRGSSSTGGRRRSWPCARWGGAARSPWRPTRAGSGASSRRSRGAAGAPTSASGSTRSAGSCAIPGTDPLQIEPDERAVEPGAPRRPHPLAARRRLRPRRRAEGRGRAASGRTGVPPRAARR